MTEPTFNGDEELSWTELRSIFLKGKGFITLAEIVELGDIEAPVAQDRIDKYYRLGRILKEFYRDDKSIVVDSDEVAIPEVGHSRELGKLLIGGGFSRRDFPYIEVAYSLKDRDSDDDAPAHDSYESTETDSDPIH